MGQSDYGSCTQCIRITFIVCNIFFLVSNLLLMVTSYNRVLLQYFLAFCELEVPAGVLRRAGGRALHAQPGPRGRRHASSYRAYILQHYTK